MLSSRWLPIALIAAGSAVPALLAAGAGASSAAPRPIAVVTGAGNVRPAVDRYRKLLGPDNGVGPGAHATGRREINWDKVPDELASPNALPSDFFNASEAPRARGAVLLTPGDHVAVSADRSNPAGAAPRFGDINPTYPKQFRTFSPERLFWPIGSNIVNLHFYVPGTHVPALVRGFGAVYTDVDRQENTAFQYFDARGHLLGKFPVPRSPSGLSFLGVVYRDAVVARVRIEYGSVPLGPNEAAGYDVAVMDDFIYGEPQPARP